MTVRRSRAGAALAASLTLGLALSGCAQGERELGVVLGDTPTSDVIAIPGDLEARVQRAIDALPGIIDDLLERSGVPGLAVAVVHGDEVRYAEGFGVREIGTDAEVTADTVFQIASVSKPLSATAVAAVIGDGEIGWDTRISELLPGFQFSDPVVTERATIADAFSHRTGLATGAGDDLEDLGFDQATILERLRLQPLDAFRASYHYSNFGLTVGAEAVAASQGQEWADLVAERVFEPLGMTSTSARHDDFLARDNRALLHAQVGGEYVAAYDRNPDAEAPAGGVSSTVRDLGNWVRMLLAEGEFEGARVADRDALVAAMSPQVVVGHPASVRDRAGFYGYGFNTGTSITGRTVMSHSGGFLLGAATNVELVPDLDLGIVTLTNAAPIGLPEAVNATFFDLVQYGAPNRDWFEAYGGLFVGMANPMGDLVDAQRPAEPAPAPDAAQLVGRYASDYFGDLVIERAGDALVARMGPSGGVELALEPWDGATFAFAPNSENAPEGSRSSAIFTLRPDGTAQSVRLTFFDAQGLATFTRIE